MNREGALAAGEANRSWPSASAIMITSEAFLISDA